AERAMAPRLALVDFSVCAGAAIAATSPAAADAVSLAMALGASSRKTLTSDANSAPMISRRSSTTLVSMAGVAGVAGAARAAGATGGVATGTVLAGVGTAARLGRGDAVTG